MPTEAGRLSEKVTMDGEALAQVHTRALPTAPLGPTLFNGSAIRILARQVYILQATDWTTPSWGN